jgi:hypothetical protein
VSARRFYDEYPRYKVCIFRPPNLRNLLEMKQPVTDSQINSPSMLRLTQTIRCGGSTPSRMPKASTAPDGWKPTPNDQVTVETQTYRYLDLKSAGEYSSAYAMFSDSTKEASHFDSWQTSAQSFNARAGQPMSPYAAVTSPGTAHPPATIQSFTRRKSCIAKASIAMMKPAEVAALAAKLGCSAK